MRDQLDNDALEARKHGMRYGDYMVIKTRAPARPVPKAPEERKCLVCGAPLIRAKQKKYCGDECRMNAQHLKKRGVL